MNIEQLKLFQEASRLGSFAEVARKHNTDPSTISRGIAQLEKEIGIRLFQRSTRKLSLSEAGARFILRVEHLIEELEQAIDEAQALNFQPKGTLRLTASVSFGQTCLVPLINEFRERYPELGLELQLTDSVVDLISNGVDLACRLAPPVQQELIGTRLHSTFYRVVASPRYLETHKAIKQPSDLSDHAALVFGLPNFNSAWKFRKANAAIESVPINSNISISSALALRQAALQDLGLALLPNWLVDNDIESGALQRVLANYECSASDFKSAVWLMYPSRQYLPYKTRVLIDFLKEKLSDE